jgi:hypothetical protein
MKKNRKKISKRTKENKIMKERNDLKGKKTREEGKTDM